MHCTIQGPFMGKPSATSSFFNELLRSSIAKWFTLHEKHKFGVQKQWKMDQCTW